MPSLALEICEFHQNYIFQSEFGFLKLLFSVVEREFSVVEREFNSRHYDILHGLL